MSEKDKMNKMRAKKGFFFTVTIILLLSAIATLLFLWVNVQNQQEKLVEQRYQFHNVGQVFDLISQEQVERFSNISINYAFYTLTDYLSSTPYKLSPAPWTLNDNDDTGNVNVSVYELFMNGTTNHFSGGGPLSYSGANMSLTYLNWSHRIDELCNEMGCSCNISQPRDFVFYQKTPWVAHVYFIVDTYANCSGSSISHDNMVIDFDINLTGLSDPMISSYMVSESSDSSARRQFFKNPIYNESSQIGNDVNVLESAYKGKGFFYGPVIDITGHIPPSSGIIPSNQNKQIIYGKWDDIKRYMNTPVSSSGGPSLFDLYGGVIVHDADVNITETNTTHSYTDTVSITLCDGNTHSCDITCERTHVNSTVWEPDCVMDCFNISSVTTVDEFSLPSGSPCPLVSCPGGGFENVFSVWTTDPAYEPQRQALCNNAASDIDSSFIEITNITDKAFVALRDSITSWPDKPQYFPLNYVRNNHNVLINSEPEINVTLLTDTTEIANQELDDNIIPGLGNPNHRVWDIESLRDMMGCSYYVESKFGPSFFQRMVKQGWNLSSNSFGVESFVVGEWTVMDGETYNCSNIDHEFLKCVMNGDTDYQGVKIKGMPGNKDSPMCSMDSPIGHFRFPDVGGRSNAAEDYGVYKGSNGEDLFGYDGARCD
ncbi:hypothetical protein J7J26_00810 [Candidatus Micrarchaeota archaeon]|nr:hypothetical protein [Candidatus Micrarchaeota archaeon]